jgi:hypothetical protein
MALVLLGIICFGLYYWNRSVLNEMETKLAAVKEEHQQVKGELDKLTPTFNILWQTAGWESQNVLWLDVIKDLSAVLPDGTELVVAQMTLTTGPINRNPRFAGAITLSGMVRDPAVLMKLQSDLHASGRYLMQHPSPRRNPADGGYPWLFNTVIYRVRT